MINVMKAILNLCTYNMLTLLQ